MTLYGLYNHVERKHEDRCVLRSRRCGPAFLSPRLCAGSTSSATFPVATSVVSLSKRGRRSSTCGPFVACLVYDTRAHAKHPAVLIG